MDCLPSPLLPGHGAVALALAIDQPGLRAARDDPRRPRIYRLVARLQLIREGALLQRRGGNFYGETRQRVSGLDASREYGVFY